MPKENKGTVRTIRFRHIHKAPNGFLELRVSADLLGDRVAIPKRRVRENGDTADPGVFRVAVPGQIDPDDAAPGRCTVGGIALCLAKREAFEDQTKSVEVLISVGLDRIDHRSPIPTRVVVPAVHEHHDHHSVRER